MKQRAASWRNPLVFSVLSALAGWLGLALNNLLGLTDPNQNLGLLVFLLLPPVTGLLLRAFGGDGWGRSRWEAQFARQSGGIRHRVGSWAGHCDDRHVGRRPGQGAGLPDLANHLLTGGVWAVWHFPYWLFLLDRSTLQEFTTVSLPVFVALSVLNLVTSAILYGEVRLLTGSTWSAVLLHTAANAFTLALLLEGFVSVEPDREVWFSPGGIGLSGIALTTLAGLGMLLYRRRKKT